MFILSLLVTLPVLGEVIVICGAVVSTVTAILIEPLLLMHLQPRLLRQFALPEVPIDGVSFILNIYNRINSIHFYI